MSSVFKSKNLALIKEAKKLIPPLTEDMHKGQMGRIVVVGGSLEYTGAPYFSAISALRVGMDLGHVICEPSAAMVIKTYSPDLIVHPLLLSSDDGRVDVDQKEINHQTSKIKELLSRLHVVVVGPGLSRDPVMHQMAIEIITEAKKLDLPLVIDADGLYLIQNNPDLIKGYHRAVLTPNVVEFKRLCSKMSIYDQPEKNMASELSLALGGVVIVQKGKEDIITNGENILKVTSPGQNLKRCGGQGDLLSGAIGAFMGWEKLYQENSWKHDKSVDPKMSKLYGCFSASSIIKLSSSKAFETHGQSMQTSDVVARIYDAYKDIFME